jgi:hypothetical protein
MRAVGAPSRFRRTAGPVRAARIFTLAAAVLAIGGGLVFAQDDFPPIGPSATIGTLGAARENGILKKTSAPLPAPAPAESRDKAVLTVASPAATVTPSSNAPASDAPAAEISAASGAVSTEPATAAAASAPSDGAPAADRTATPSAAAEASSVASAVPEEAASVPTPSGGSKTIVINGGAPVSGWTPVTPEPPANGATAGAADSGAPAPAALPDSAVSVSNGSTNVVQTIEPDEIPTGTTEIPQANQESGADSQNPQVANYEANQQMPLNEPQLHTLQEFMNEGVNASPLGVELEEGARRTKTGREVDGLLVVALQHGSPAERAGVQAGHRAAHDVAEGVAVAASLVFPPAVLAVPVIETVQFGENYDLIIGIDGNRVSNFMDFQDRLRDARPGETVYLNILRGGNRLQIPVQMPPPNLSKLQP